MVEHLGIVRIIVLKALEYGHSFVEFKSVVIVLQQKQTRFNPQFVYGGVLETFLQYGKRFGHMTLPGFTDTQEIFGFR